MLKQKQVQRLTFATLADLTASSLNTPEFAFITAENAFYTKIAGVNTLIDKGGDDWSLLGNAGTTAGTNFIGTTDNVDVTIKRNNLPEFIAKGDGIFTVNNSNKRNLFIQYGNTAAGNTTLTGEYNSVIGGSGLTALNVGYHNGVGMGYGLSALTDGSFNGVSMGYGLTALTNGSYNGVSTGYGLNALTTGEYNSVNVGKGLFALTNGNYNEVSIGRGLDALVDGSFNGVSTGYGLTALTTGNFNMVNVGVGLNALTTGYYNAVNVGKGLYALANGEYNGVSAGYGLDALNAGYHNGVSMGYGLHALTNGSYNGVSMGYGLNALTTGEYNEVRTGVGLNALISGNYNSVNVGKGLFALTNGRYNGVSIGDGLSALTTGNHNGISMGYGLESLTNNSNIVAIGENNDLNYTALYSIPFSSLTFTNATKTYTIGGASVNGLTITGADVTSIIASNITAGRVLNTLSTLDSDKQTLPVYNNIFGWTSAWMLDANTLFIPTQPAVLPTSLTNLFTSPTHNNIFMVGRNIRATKSNQFIIGGQGTEEVKFRGENGYNYNHDVSAVLTSADDDNTWTYDHATTSIKMKPVGKFVSLTSLSPAAGTTATSLNFGNNTKAYINVDLPTANSTTTFALSNIKLGSEYIVRFNNTSDSSINNIAFAPGSFLEKDGSTLKRLNGLRNSVIYRFVALSSSVLTLISKSDYISRQFQTTHGDSPMLDRINHYYYKDVSLQAVGYTLTLPANPDYDNELTVYFGDNTNTNSTCGSVSLAPAAGQTIVNSGISLAANRANGETITLKCDYNNIWRIVARYVPS
jgi:hypothetical protein